jgi:GAF domain-containing protein/anti-sigma regulatory factor (Ser/Thr protein kinase)
MSAGDPTAARLRDLSAITEVALAHLDLDRLLDVLLERVRGILGTDTAAILMLEPESNELVARAAKGIEEEVEQGVRIPVGAGFAGRIMAEGRPVHLPDVRPGLVVNPILLEKGIRSLLGVPLVVEGEAIGVLHVGTLQQRAFDEDDTTLLQLVGDRIALAIDHARLFEAERQARLEAERTAEELGKIQSITDAALGRLTLDDDLLGALLDRLRDVLEVDTAAILLLAAEGDELVARAARGIEEEVEQGVRIPVDSGFAGRIAAEARPVYLPDVEHADVYNPLLRQRGIRSLLGVPLITEGEVLGVLHVGSLTQRSFAEGEVALLERAADRIALTIDRRRKHNIAELLQRQFLPGRLPQLPGTITAARYLAGADDTHVGGDWYDALPLPAGRMGVLMGDVVSRGLRAAIVMGQLRIGLRAYAIEGDSPGRVLDKLDRLAQTMFDSEMATIAYVVIDPTSGRLEYSVAGHPPPLVIAADGSTRYLDAVKSRPVGVLPGRRYEEAEDALGPGDTLLLYTDGLVERRGSPLADGLAELADEAGRSAEDPHVLCDALVARFAEGALDDVALLAVKLVGDRDDELRLSLPAEPESLGTIRRALRDWMGRVGVDGAASQDVLLAVGEAATNAVEHAYGPGEAEFELIAQLDGRDVAVSVRDSGRWREPRGAHRGRGLSMMQELMDQVEVESGAAGTVIRMRRAAGEEPAG